jgi:hypothetical protein
MTGDPGDLTTSVGSAIAILDACLVDGFGEVTLDSLVVSSNVATGTLSTGHNFTMIGATGPVILIAGATPSGLNGEWRVTVTSSTAFTFVTSGISDQTATGTITAKRAPAGWEAASSGTNAKYYRSLDVDGMRFVLSASDNDSSDPYVCSIALREGDLSSSNELAGTFYLHKSATYPGWSLIADANACYLLAYNGAFPYGSMFFGDLTERYDPADQYAAVIGGHVAATTAVAATNYGLINSLRTASNYGAKLAKSKTGTNGVHAWRVTHANAAQAVSTYNLIGAGGTAVLGNREIVYPIEVWQAADDIYRGKMPGWYGSLHGLNGLTGIVEHSGLGRTLKALPMYYNTNTAWQLFDVTGPWR